jgi:hypothetical protein
MNLDVEIREFERVLAFAGNSVHDCDCAVCQERGDLDRRTALARWLTMPPLVQARWLDEHEDDGWPDFLQRLIAHAADLGVDVEGLREIQRRNPEEA